MNGLYLVFTNFEFTLYFNALSSENSLVFYTYCDMGHPFIHVMVISEDP